MRLIDVHTFPPPPPKYKLTKRQYAILSHTWEEDELVLGDLSNSEGAVGKSSWDKIRGAQSIAKKDGFDFVWIDTLRIDKTSSAELAEAINSMYTWYRKADVCYVYLSDVECLRGSRSVATDSVVGAVLRGGDFEQFKNSRWFKRGWTLQELLAPKLVRFYDKRWNFIGNLKDLAEIVAGITRIHITAILEIDPNEFSIAQRMSWAADRETTKEEDRAYSLLGLLDVNMDIRYGEGSKAFMRLQEEIILRSTDQSIFAWGEPLNDQEDENVASTSGSMDTDLLASSPDDFRNASSIVPIYDFIWSCSMTNKGLRITAPVLRERQLLLSCGYVADPTTAILLNFYPRINRNYPETKERISLKAPRSAKRSTRLSLRNMTEATLASERTELTIRMNPYAAAFGAQGSAELPSNRPGTLWVILDEACVSIMNPTPGPKGKDSEFRHSQKFVFEASEPEPNGRTRILTYSSRSDSVGFRHSLGIRLRHSSGRTVELSVGTERGFMFDQGFVAITTATRAEHNVNLLKRRAERETDSHTNTRILPTEYLHVINRTEAVLVVLRAERVSGMLPYVLRVSMIRPSPGVLWRYWSMLVRAQWMEYRIRSYRIRTSKAKAWAISSCLFGFFSSQVLLSWLRRIRWLPIVMMKQDNAYFIGCQVMGLLTLLSLVLPDIKSDNTLLGIRNAVICASALGIYALIAYLVWPKAEVDF